MSRSVMSRTKNTEGDAPSGVDIIVSPSPESNELHFEGFPLEAVLTRVYAEQGAGANIVSADRVRRGGVGGFFARELFRVTVKPLLAPPAVADQELNFVPLGRISIFDDDVDRRDDDIDPEDIDAIDAALREAEEEVRLSRANVQIVSALDTYRTVTGFDITPVLAVIPPDLPLIPHDREVAAVFEVPLAFVLDTANRNERSITIEGVERRYFETMWGERRIWGATAAILANLSARLKW